MIYCLKLSKNRTFYSLFKKGDDIQLFSLSTLYSVALVKALCNYVKLPDKLVINVKKEHRVLYGETAPGHKNAVKQGTYPCFPVGKYSYRSVKSIYKKDKQYLQWFWKNVKGNETTKTWILYYMPELAVNCLTKPLFYKGQNNQKERYKK